MREGGGGISHGNVHDSPIAQELSQKEQAIWVTELHGDIMTDSWAAARSSAYERPFGHLVGNTPYIMAQKQFTSKVEPD
jgi:hypothetical protein